MTSRKCCIIWIQSGIGSLPDPLSASVFILKELNAVEGEVWFRDYNKAGGAAPTAQAMT